MLKRHDLVRLTPDGWEQALATLVGKAAELATHWRGRDLPAVVRRTDPNLASDMICLGLPAPPDPHTGHKLRLGIAVARSHIASMRPPLALHEAEVAAESHVAFGALRAAMRDAGIDCRVFGSVAMQTLTGERYLGPGSDIDLLVRPTNPYQLEVGLDLIASSAQRLPLDGEIEFPSGQAVSWKEWQVLRQHDGLGAGRVLVKNLDTVALVRCDELLGQLRGDVHA